MFGLFVLITFYNNGKVQLSSLLGARWSIQVGEVCFSGARSNSYEAMILSREAATEAELVEWGRDPADAKKGAFRVNIPTSCYLPLRAAVLNMGKDIEIPEAYKSFEMSE